MGKVERDVEGPGYRDQVMALAQDRMIRPELGVKAMKHFRKMGEAELAWLAVMWRVRESQGDVQVSGEGHSLGMQDSWPSMVSSHLQAKAG